MAQEYHYREDRKRVEALEAEVRVLREALLNIQTRAGGYIAPGEAEPQRLLRLIRQWAEHALAPEPPGRA